MWTSGSPWHEGKKLWVSTFAFTLILGGFGGRWIAQARPVFMSREATGKVITKSMVTINKEQRQMWLRWQNG